MSCFSSIQSCTLYIYSIFMLLQGSSPHFLFGTFKAVGNKVNRLVLCDGVFLEAGLVGVKGQNFGLVRQAVLRKKTPNKKHREETISPLFSTLNRKCGIAE